METLTKTCGRRLVGAIAALGVVTSIVIAAAVVFSPDAAAQDQQGGRICSESTLRGDYGLLASGVRKLPPPQGGATEHFVATALWSFHGDGTFTQRSGAALHGELTGVAPPQNELPGTYQVNENCTGRMLLIVPELPFPIEYSFVIVNNARQISAAVMRPGVATAELVRK